jgi:DNA-binding PadR family transcriptional regulator
MGEPGPRDRRTYRLTAAGRRAFAAWLAEEPGPEQIRMPLLLTMHFGSRIGRKRMLEIVERHRAVHAERLRGYEEIRAAAHGTDFDPYVLATLEFGLSYERAVLRWIERLPEVLTEDR